MSVYGYRYGRVPEVLLYSDASDRACRLHAVLTRWADTKAGQHPTREELARLLRCSVDSLDRAIKELKDGGYLDARPQYGPDGNGRVANDYVLLEGRTDAAGGSRTDAATVTSANAEPADKGGRKAAARGSRTGAAAIEVRDRTQREPNEELPPTAAEIAPHRVTSRDLLAEHIDALGYEPATKGRLASVTKRLLDRQHVDPDVVRAALARMRERGLTSPSVLEGMVDDVQGGKTPRADQRPARYSLNGDTVTPPTELLAWARRGDTADGRTLEAGA